MEVTRYEAEDRWWAMASGLPHPALRGDVVGYTGYAEHSVKPVRRRELPSPHVTVIVSLGPTIDVLTSDDALLGRLTSFVAGCAEGFAVTEYVGGQRGLEISLTPLGAFRLLGLSGDEIRHGVLNLDDLLGRRAHELADRLVSAPDWPTRYAITDDFLLGLAAAGRSVDGAVGWAWQRLVDSSGRVPIGALAADIGWSRRHLIQRFRRHAGLSPKGAARVIRFDRAARLLGENRPISEVAAAAGFADHSHLVREFHAMAGCTPSDLLAEWGVDGEIRPGQLEVTKVQDAR